MSPSSNSIYSTCPYFIKSELKKLESGIRLRSDAAHQPMSKVARHAVAVFQRVQHSDCQYFLIGEGLTQDRSLCDHHGTFNWQGQDRKGAIFAQKPYSRIVNDVWILGIILGGREVMLLQSPRIKDRSKHPLRGVRRELTILKHFGYQVTGETSDEKGRKFTILSLSNRESAVECTLTAICTLVDKLSRTFNKS